MFFPQLLNLSEFSLSEYPWSENAWICVNLSCVSSNFFKTEHQLNVSLKLELFIPSLYAYIEFTSVNVKHEAVLFYVQFLAI